MTIEETQSDFKNEMNLYLTPKKIKTLNLYNQWKKTFYLWLIKQQDEIYKLL